MLHMKYLMGPWVLGVQERGTTGEGAAHLEPDTSGDRAACSGCQSRVRRSIKQMRKNVNIAAPVADYGLCLSWSQPVNMPHSDEYFGQYCIRFILRYWWKFFFWVHHNEENGKKKKRCLWPLHAIPSLALSDSKARHLHQFKKNCKLSACFITHGPSLIFLSPI